MINKKVAILQSNYIPWKGYFDIIASVDEFIFYDEMQYTTRDWRNRNKIQTKNGLQWLTIPAESKSTRDKKISEITIIDDSWARKHWNTIVLNYSKAPYFAEYKTLFEELYAECAAEKYLCQVNYKFIIAINKILGITTKLSFDKDYGIIEGKTERLVDLCKKAGATEYISGPAAKDYIDEELFADSNIKLSWMSYAGYGEYPQLHSPFEHGVTILDLIFNCGKNARSFMKG